MLPETFQGLAAIALCNNIFQALHRALLSIGNPIARPWIVRVNIPRIRIVPVWHTRFFVSLNHSIAVSALPLEPASQRHADFSKLFCLLIRETKCAKHFILSCESLCLFACHNFIPS